MKMTLLQQQPRRTPSSRPSSSPPDAPDSHLAKPAASLLWLLLHALCCLVSLLLGFRFSRLLFFLLFSPSSTTTTTTTSSLPLPLPLLLPSSPPNRTLISRVAVGRHGIRIRPWPHPDPSQTLRAHRIIHQVQHQQRLHYGIKNPKPLIVITPTFVRTFQTLHLTALIHSLSLLPSDLTWIVVEAGGATNETAALLARSHLNVLHLSYKRKMPIEWPDRRRMETQMRLHALRAVRDRRMDGILVFADDSNVHSVELFDEIQKVRWIGGVSVGILTRSENSLAVQGPACDSSGRLVGWRTFDGLPVKLEWAGFVLNSRLVWKEAEGRPDWVRDLDDVGENGEEIESPLALLKDASFVEPLGNCGKKVLLWWLRAEARYDSKFPPRWILDPPLEVVVPAKSTPWPDEPPEFPSEMTSANHELMESRSRIAGGYSRSRHGSQRHEN